MTAGFPVWLRSAAIALASCGCLVSLSAVAAEDAAAEYAIRWSAVDGGPQSIKELKALLQIGKAKKKSFEVRYFSVDLPAGAPGAGDLIARERTEKGKTESMIKLRSTEPFPAAGGLAEWRCPFISESGRKHEVDIGWTGKDTFARKYSKSCEADGVLAKAVPASYAVKPVGCVNSVRREEGKGITIERWKFANGETVFEVSMKGNDTRVDHERFDKTVVRPIIRQGAKPLSDSKTQLGSQC